MDVKIRKIISLSLNFLAAAFIAVVLWGFSSLGYKPELIENARASGVVSEILLVKLEVEELCKGNITSQILMPKSKLMQFSFAQKKDDDKVWLLASCKNPEFCKSGMAGQQALRIDEKLDDGLPNSGKVRFVGQSSCLMQSEKSDAIYDKDYDGECSTFTVEIDCKEAAEAKLIDSQKKPLVLPNEGFEKALQELLIVSTDDVYRDGWNAPRSIDMAARQKLFSEFAWIKYKKFIDKQKSIMGTKIVIARKRYEEFQKQNNRPIEPAAGTMKVVAHFDPNASKYISQTAPDRAFYTTGRFLYGAGDAYFTTENDKFRLSVVFYADPKNPENFLIKEWKLFW